MLFGVMPAVALLAATAAARAPGEGDTGSPARSLPADGALDLRIVSPAPGRPVFGEVEIVVEVLSDSPRRVVFLVDGRRVGERTAPPFRLTADVGAENRAHRFEVVAEAAGGVTVRRVVETPAISIDLEVDVELRQLYVTVTRGGQPALDLGAGDFAVLDQGERQRLVTFERGDVPFTALLLVDASESMRGGRLESALAGVEAFAAGLRPFDQARVVLFADRLRHATPFTSFPELLTAGLPGFGPAGGTALNDHLYVALKQLEERQGRRLVVVLSDGVDVSSVLAMADLLPVARRGSALVYWIRPGPAEPDGGSSSAWRNAGAHRRERQLLERLVTESGGRILPIGSAAEAPGAFARVLQEVRDQYVLGYYPSRRLGDGSWHRVAVRVPTGHRARTRRGYVDL